MKYKKLLTLSSVIVLGLPALTIFPANVQASETNTIQNEAISSLEIQASFDLSNLSVGESDTKELTLPSGETMTLKIEKLSDGEEDDSQPMLLSSTGYTEHHSQKVSNGTYNVNVIYVATNAGFKVDIKDGKIARAYDPWHFHIYASSNSLTKDSDYQATMSIEFSMAIPWINGPSWSGGVRARMESGNLVTYVH